MNKPQPKPSPWDGEFWDNARNGQLVIQKCLDCGGLQMYPRPVCVHCRSTNMSWQQSPGTGKLYSHTVVMAPISPTFKEDVPIYFADVELDEGVRILARLIGDGADTATIDAPAQIVFEPNQEGGVPVPCVKLV